MPSDKYKKVKSFLHPAISLPENFFLPSMHGAESCIFMLSCLGNDKLLFLDDSFQSLSGYLPEKIKEGGMDFWFSLIHPDDNEQISEKIIESHRLLATHGFNEKEPSPLVLTYRIKHANGQWVWIRDTKYLVSFSEKIIDKVLGKFEEVLPEPGTETALKKKLEEEKSCTQLLEFALVHQHDKRKQVLDPEHAGKDKPVAALSSLTRREKEILQLIAEGLSTKIIAGKCNISIHTVETHRRHLLEKLQVKNSMELIKEASKIYWL
jgi:DNA-binding CsgD family transcriptional regulator